MKIYFVRHGESEGNIGPFIQCSEESLTIKGLRQAETIAKRFKNIPIDIILSSPEERAKKTAEIMSKEINMVLEFSDLLIEFVRPSIFNKKLKNDGEVKKIKKILKNNFHISGWKYSDEENFEDFKKRVLNFLDNLSSRKESNIIVVTHSVFMRMIIAIIIMGRNLTSYEYWNFFISLYLDNTGITILESNDLNNNTEDYIDIPMWKLITWNDHSHLL